MTTEEKAKAYDELFVKASRIYNKENDMLIMHTIEVLFPELKGSDGERIRKALISFLKSPFVNENITDEKVTPWIAWLEKLKVFAEHGDGLYYFGNNGFTYVGNPTCDNVLWIEKQGEQKPASKVKPKFKADDFILNGDVTDDGKPEIFKVLNVQDTWYAVESIYDGRNTIITFKQDSSCRLWDLTKDTKDGDFLVCGKDKLPFIFKGLLDKLHPNCPVAYCGICEDGIVGISSGDGWWTDEEVFPANKEQREQLEKAISDAGYIWDAEKKELKKLQPQWKPSEEQMKLLREVQQALLGKDCHNRFVNFMYELERLREE